MDGTTLVIMCIGALGAVCIAAAKNRSVVAWLFIGALVPVISIIALVVAPAVPKLADDNKTS